MRTLLYLLGASLIGEGREKDYIYRSWCTYNPAAISHLFLDYSWCRATNQSVRLPLTRELCESRLLVKNDPFFGQVKAKGLMFVPSSASLAPVNTANNSCQYIFVGYIYIYISFPSSLTAWSAFYCALLLTGGLGVIASCINDSATTGAPLLLLLLLLLAVLLVVVVDRRHCCRHFSNISARAKSRGQLVIPLPL